MYALLVAYWLQMKKKQDPVKSASKRGVQTEKTSNRRDQRNMSRVYDRGLIPRPREECLNVLGVLSRGYSVYVEKHKPVSRARVRVASYRSEHYPAI